MTTKEKIYDAALENMRFHIETSNYLNKEANATLSLMLGASLAGFSFVLHLLSEGGSWGLKLGIGAAAIHLLILCAGLVHYCLKPRRISPPTNEPKNFPDGYDWGELLEVECENLQKRIESNTSRNLETANWLDRVKTAALFSPLTCLFFGLVGVTLEVAAA